MNYNSPSINGVRQITDRPNSTTGLPSGLRSGLSKERRVKTNNPAPSTPSPRGHA